MLHLRRDMICLFLVIFSNCCYFKTVGLTQNFRCLACIRDLEDEATLGSHFCVTTIAWI